MKLLHAYIATIPMCSLVIAPPLYGQLQTSTQVSGTTCFDSVGSGIGTPGMDGMVRVLKSFDDGRGMGPQLYAGGSFATAGGVAANRIARWDGQRWNALGTGMSASVLALEGYDDSSGRALYAGGFFTQADSTVVNRISKWDGANWLPLGAGLDNTVYALSTYHDGSQERLYVGGSFSTAGSVVVNGIASWDGTAWSALTSGIGGTDPRIYAMTTFDDGTGPKLYVAGSFNTAGGAAAASIAAWDGATWSALAGGITGTVLSMEVYDDGSGTALYVGGDFVMAGSVTANNIAKWDGSTWADVGLGASGTIPWVFELKSVDLTGQLPALFAGGAFTQMDVAPVDNVAALSDGAWSRLGGGGVGGGPPPFVRTIEVHNDNIFLGGEFTRASSVPANFIAQLLLCDETTGPDCNDNGISDSVDITSLTSMDCDLNGRPDECQLDSGIAKDCNLNGVLDACDITSGSSVDSNGNGVPDECDAGIIYVNSAAAPGGNGLSWAAALADLQDGLDYAAASSGTFNNIWVAAGTYLPDRGTGDRSASFHLVNSVALFGGFSGTETMLSQRDWTTNVTTLSGDLTGDDEPGYMNYGENSYHVVIADNVGSSTILDGFVIRSGYATGPSPDDLGAGLLLNSANPTLANCTIAENLANSDGGGLYANGISNPSISDCAFDDNWANYGGGLATEGSSAASLTRCAFSRNIGSWGGGVYHTGNGADDTFYVYADG